MADETRAATQAVPRRPDLFSRFQRMADVLALAAAYAAAACLAALVLLVLAEVAVSFLSRFSARIPSNIPIAWEYSAYLMGASFMLGTALTLRAGMHVRVELLIQGGKGRHARIMELLSSMIGAVLAITLAWTFTAFAIRSFTSNQLSQDSFTPLWIPQAPLAIGAILLAIEMVARLFACLLGRAVDSEDFRVSSSTTE
jgi:TRAP-type mannitol/chloroaromatic compound transport system permease small subunit